MGFFDVLSGIGNKILNVTTLGAWDTLTGFKTSDQNREIQAEQSDLSKAQFEYLKGQDAWQRNFAQQQFDYQKYYDANRTQIASADARLAGINPLVMAGAPTSSVGVSGGSSSVGQSGASMAPLQSNLGSLIGAITGLASVNAQKQIGSLNADTTLEKARMDNETLKSIESMRSSTQKQIAREDRLSRENITREQIQATASNIQAQLKSDKFREELKLETERYIASQKNISDMDRQQVIQASQELMNAKTNKTQIITSAIYGTSNVLSGFMSKVLGIFGRK
ncbi:DNA pilot protein [Tortoise microvirus 17]|nr:DNA pilot protein [Tortoise microvirus 17]